MTKYVLEDGNGNRLDHPSLIGGPVYDDEMRALAMKDWATSLSHFPDPVTVETVEQSDEDNSNDTMTDYSFISDDDEDESDNQQSDGNDYSVVGNKWTMGDHSTASDDERSALSQSIDETLNALDDDIDGDMKAVLRDAGNLVQDTNVSRFECPVESCGLGHSHPDYKHDIRSGFNVEDSFASGMKFVPYCHCGVNELSMLMAFFPYITEPVFTDQHQFEGVLEVEPDILDSMYRRFIEDDLSVSRAAAVVAREYGVEESEAVPLGVREDLKLFFQRRRNIEDAANSAPIAQETRGVITQNREVLEDRTSQ